jgi:hypothetical protein
MPSSAVLALLCSLALAAATAGEAQAQEPVATGSGSAEAEDKTADGARELPVSVWVAAGVTGASLVAGVVLGFLALDAQTDFDKRPNAAVADRGERLAIYADVLFGVAAAAGLTGIVIYATEVEPVRVAVAPRVSPSAAGAVLSVSF